ncbi:MAG: hypothetical protein AAB657_02380, partial [Patescibacteria group bacterium]
MKVEQLAKYYLTATLVVVFTSIGALGALSIKGQDGLVKRVSNKFASCTPQTLNSETVGGLSVAIPKLPDALRLNYGDNNTAQYSTKSKPEQVFTYYLSELPSNCWKLVALQDKEAVWKRNGESVKIAAVVPPVGGKTIVSYEAAQGQVLGVMVRAAQTTTCTDGQMYCPGSNGGSGWCQSAGTTCPTPTTTTPTCPTPPSSCTGGFIYDGQGCATSCQPTAPVTPTCTSDQYLCNNACINNSSSCYQNGNTSCGPGYMNCNNSCVLPGTCNNTTTNTNNNSNTNYSTWPTDRASCTSQSKIWCDGTNGSSGWCQMSGTTCPSTTNTNNYYNNWPTDQASCTAQGQLWCNGTNGSSGACQMAGTTCPSSYNTNNNTSTWPNDQASCTAQSKYWCYPTSGGAGYCQGGPCPSPTDTNTNYNNWPMDRASCTSQSKVWCDGMNGANGWCMATGGVCPSYTNTNSSCPSGQMWCPGLYGGAGSCVNGSTCPTVGSTGTNNGPTACSSDRYWCASANTCISNSSTCAPTNTNTYAGDANSCPGFAYSKWDKQGKRYCQLNSERRCDYNYPSYLTNSGNYTTTSCPSDESTPQPVPPTSQREQIWNSKGLRSWIRTDADQSRIDQLKNACANVTNMANVWLPEAGSSTSKDFGFPSADKCAKAATCTTTQYFDGTSCSNSGTTANQTPASCGSGQMWCAGSNGSSGWCQMSGTTCPTYTTPTCRSSEYMCNNICIPNGSACNGYPYYENNNQPSCGSGSRYCSTQARCVTNSQTCETPAVNTCPTSMYWCPTQNRCMGSYETCGAPVPPPMPPVNYPTNQPIVNQPIPQPDLPIYNPTPIDNQQFQMMKRNLSQFVSQIKNMKRQVDRLEKKLRGVVGIPPELKAALSKSDDIITRVKAAKTAEEMEGLEDDIYDVVQTMQEWGPRLGDLTRLREMLTQAGRELRNLQVAVKRSEGLIKRNASLTEIVQELKDLFSTMNQAVISARELAKTDPDGALDKLEIDFYGGMEEFWNQNELIGMLSDIQKGSSNANQQIRKAETEIRNAEKAKRISAEAIADLKNMITGIKEDLAEVKRVGSGKKINQDDLFMVAEDLWEAFTDF